MTSEFLWLSHLKTVFLSVHLLRRHDIFRRLLYISQGSGCWILTDDPQQALALRRFNILLVLKISGKYFFCENIFSAGFENFWQILALRTFSILLLGSENSDRDLL